MAAISIVRRKSSIVYSMPSLSQTLFNSVISDCLSNRHDYEKEMADAWTKWGVSMSPGLCGAISPKPLKAQRGLAAHPAGALFLAGHCGRLYAAGRPPP
jgi:hypothetical protein